MKFQRLILDTNRGFGYDAMDLGRPYSGEQIVLGQNALAKHWLDDNIAVHRMPLVEYISPGHKRAPINVIIYSTKETIENLKLVPAFQRMPHDRSLCTDFQDVVGWMHVETIHTSLEQQLTTFTPMIILRDKPFIIKKMDRFFNPIIERYKEEYHASAVHP